VDLVALYPTGFVKLNSSASSKFSAKEIVYDCIVTSDCGFAVVFLINFLLPQVAMEPLSLL